VTESKGVGRLSALLCGRGGSVLVDVACHADPTLVIARGVAPGRTTPARLASIVDRPRHASGGCRCCEPRPGSILQAVGRLAMPPNRCVAA
jgi:hypothetical protein